MRDKIINSLIVILVAAGLVMTFTNKDSGTDLMSTGFDNLKYYTVLSNIFAGIVAIPALFTDRKPVKALKLMSASATSVTFSVVAFFLGPLYGHINLYRNANLLFHLIVPLIAMFDYITLKGTCKEFKYTLISAVPTVIYGCGYMLNILINGIGGEYPNTNDFYLFLNWGWGVGIIIFLCIVILTFALACILRAGNKAFLRKSE